MNAEEHIRFGCSVRKDSGRAARFEILLAGPSGREQLGSKSSMLAGTIIPAKSLKYSIVDERRVKQRRDKKYRVPSSVKHGHPVCKNDVESDVEKMANDGPSSSHRLYTLVEFPGYKNVECC